MKTDTVIEIGDKAPDFMLKDQEDKNIQLSEVADKKEKVLLSFHPLAWTRVCAEQMKSLETHRQAFEDLNTVALGVSVDTVPSKRAWADHLGIKETRLLSDFWPHGKVASLYGIFREKDGFSERANIVVGPDHNVIFVKVYPISQLPDIGEIVRFIREGTTG